MKKRTLWVIPVILSLLLCSCAKTPSDTAPTSDTQAEESAGISEKSLYEHGLELISVMYEMAESEDYLAIVLPINESMEYLKSAVSEDPSKPDAVYEINGIGNSIFEDEQLEEIQKMPQALQEYFESRSTMNFASIMNSYAGSTAVAAVSVTTATKTFVNKSISANTVYLYMYDDGCPVLVSFVCGEDNTVYAQGQYIFAEDMADDVEGFFKKFPITGLTVKELEF